MTDSQNLHIAIVNALPQSRGALRRVIETQPNWRVSWAAESAAEALIYCANVLPDLVLIDLQLPDISGVQLTCAIMAVSPCAILIVARDVEAQSSAVCDSMTAGALGAAELPSTEDAVQLLDMIRMVSRLLGRGRTGGNPHKPEPVKAISAQESSGMPTLIAIGASTGGPAALRELLGQLPADFAPALVIAQHLDVQFAAGMADWLASSCPLPLRVACEGDRPIAGQVLLAASNNHLVLRENGTLSYSVEPRAQPYRPSVDELFASAALFWPGTIIGVLLTGMGQDGARGLLALRRLGHHTFAQDKASSAVYGMPGTAAQWNAAVEQMNPSQIGAALVRMASAAKSAKRG